MELIEKLKKIDKSNPIPYHIQIKDAIRSIIEQGLFKPGDLIPGESDLCEYFDVSRPVIRQALNGLYHEGLVIRKKGKGTFIREPKILERFGQEITGFYQEMTSRSYQIKTEVLEQEIISANNEEISAYLSINIDEPIVLLKRLRYLRDEPILIVTSFLPANKCNGLIEEDFSELSLYEFLERRMGCKLSYGKRSIEAVLADFEQAKLLKIRKGDPLLFISSIIYLEDGTPIEYYQSYYRADRYKFEVELIKLREYSKFNQFLIGQKKSLPSSAGVLKKSQ